MATTNEEMYLKDWQESVPQMTTEELYNVISNAQDYNPQFVLIVKDEYEKRSPIENNNDEPQENVKEVLSTQDKNSSNMSWWLYAILLVIGLNGINSLRFVYGLVLDTTILSDNYMLRISLIGVNVILCFLSFYSVWSFIKRKGNSVFLTLTFLTVCIFLNIIILISGIDETLSTGLIRFFIPVIIVGVCMFYISKSDEVMEMIPEEKRYVLTLDYALVVMSALFILLGLLAAL